MPSTVRGTRNSVAREREDVSWCLHLSREAAKKQINVLKRGVGSGVGWRWKSNIENI